MWYESLLVHAPDFILRAGIRAQLAQKLREQSEGGLEARQERLTQFVAGLKKSPIAIHTADANQQHYELPPEFFRLVLGKHLKYSSGFWPEGVTGLDESEEAMLELYCRRAQLKDGQDVLDLGCGWGSLSLYLAAKYPNSYITGVSNSAPQKAFIDARARERGLSNLKIETADMNFFQASGGYDRILSVEMFEHMRNYEELLEKTASWMKPDGLLFLHIFVHKDYAYPFSAENSGSWMARTFFTGGIMPSEDLLLYFQKDVRLAERWRVDGRHYQKTCEAWLRKMDEAREPVMKVFRETYGKDAAKWRAYWRIFFMACAELFGYRGGGEWFVAHYLFERQSSAVASAEPSKFSESR